MNEEMIDLPSLMRNYHEVVSKVEEWKARHLRPGMFVKVNDTRFRGHGFIVMNSGCPVHEVPVKLENGNVWWYPVESLTPVTTLRSVPRSVRHARLRHHGYKPIT
jgi:hypothetical protein